MKTISKIGLGVSVFALAAAALTGCGSESGAELTARVNEGPAEQAAQPEQDAGEFMKQYVNTVALGQWGRAWDTLHPAQQQVASRSAYMTCRSEDSIPPINGVEIIEEYEEPIEVAPLGEVSSTAVTMKVSADDYPDDTLTGHVVDVDGEWRWIMTPADIETYKAGDCPQ